MGRGCALRRRLVARRTSEAGFAPLPDQLIEAVVLAIETRRGSRRLAGARGLLLGRVSINRCAPRYAAKRRRLLGVIGFVALRKIKEIRSPRVGPVFSGAVSRGCRGENRQSLGEEGDLNLHWLISRPPFPGVVDKGATRLRRAQPERVLVLFLGGFFPLTLSLSKGERAFLDSVYQRGDYGGCLAPAHISQAH